ncbi:ATP-binding protein [Streptomyces sp. MUM 178J]|uniref:ATP-binding protein n=1 Tax=Streptomyces sp. MUM 178J TaxID=2791991 RepID=UPI001F04D298|nr:ATP-binding protein [Streptomyces sp. MUM 178J]WRQ80653.1 ATP-binding protein [Streptomyces sp. MUM 178J]
MTPSLQRPVVTELRLSPFAAHRDTTVPLAAPLTLLAGPSGSGKSTALRAYEGLARLAAGEELAAAFPDPAACVPEGAGVLDGPTALDGASTWDGAAVWDGAGALDGPAALDGAAAPVSAVDRGLFRIGCTVDGPDGPVRLDLAVRAEPRLRIVGERLTSGGTTLLSTAAVRGRGHRRVQAAWHTHDASGAGGARGTRAATRAVLPDDRLATALLPLHVAGRTEGQLRVLAAAEQTVVALRSLFACDPQPERMRRPAPEGDGRLLRGCGNLADVLHRTRSECARRHGRLAAAARAGCAGPVADLTAEALADGTVRALLDRGAGRAATPVERLGDGELRFLALALVLLTGPGVLAVEQASEVPSAYQTLAVLADGLDRCLDAAQLRELLALAVEMCARGHIRLVGTVTDATAASVARGVEGASVVDLHL